MNRRLIKLIRNIRGATAIEYGLILALIAVAMIAGVSALGGTNGGAWGNMSGKVANSLPST